MSFGYAYPAFECYKIVEKNRVEIEELRFWCQYWIIVAMLTVLERLGDVFVSWLPMYGEAKVALFIYLWYPKTRGTGYIYKTLLRPLVSKHETDIDMKLLELRARAWDLTVFYWQNFAQYGQTAFFQFLQYMAAQSSKMSKTTNETVNDQSNGSAPSSNLPLRKPSGKLKWPPEANGNDTTTTTNRSVSETMKSQKVVIQTQNQTDGGQVEEEEAGGKSSPTDKPRLRRKH